MGEARLRTLAEVDEAGLVPDLRAAASAALRSGGVAAVTVVTRRTLGLDVQTLILGEVAGRAGQSIGGSPAEWGVWDEGEGVVRMDGACCAFSVAGRMVLGDARAWLAGEAAGRRVDLLLADSELATALAFVSHVTGWFENRLEDSRVNEALCRAEGSYLERAPEVMPQVEGRTLQVPLVLLADVLDVLGTTGGDGEGWSGRDARRLRKRLEAAVEGSQLGREYQEIVRVAREASSGRRRAS